MTVEHETHDSETRGFIYKRLMSFLGVVPLGVYVVLHLWTNLSSLGGAQRYDLALESSRNHPAFLALEVLLGAALLIHTVVGIGLLTRWRPSGGSTRYFRGLKFLLQRVAGIGVGLFIVAHVVKARILPAVQQAGGHENWAGMHEALSEPLTLTVYVLGLAGTSYHLANGLWTFLITWGLTVTPRAQQRAQWVSAAFLVVLLLMSGLSLYGFLQAPGSAVALGAGR